MLVVGMREMHPTKRSRQAQPVDCRFGVESAIELPRQLSGAGDLELWPG